MSPVGITRKGVSTRARILRAAAELFAVQGYAETNVGDIGAGAGVSGPAIYRHFENKGALLVAIFEEMFENLIQGCRPIVESGLPPAEVMQSLIRYQVAATLDEQGMTPFYQDGRRHLPEADLKRVTALSMSYRDEWLRVLARVRNEPLGELRAIVTGALAVISQTARQETLLPREVLEPLLVAMASAVIEARPVDA